MPAHAGFVTVLAKTKAPLSALTRLANAPLPLSVRKLAAKVSVLPGETSIARVFAVPARESEWLSVKVSVARKVEVPVQGLRRTMFAASPKTASEGMESTPAWTSMIDPLAPKELVAFVSARVPAPFLTKETAPEPVMPPVI